MWQVTPATFGSSKSATHTLSLGERKLNVVLTQLNSSAHAKAGAATKSTVAIKHSFTFDLHFQGALGRLRADRPVSSAEASSNAARKKQRRGSAESSFAGDLRGPRSYQHAIHGQCFAGDGAEPFKKNRGISRDASGPSGSVYEPCGHAESLTVAGCLGYSRFQEEN
jgi:hypothetical protein